MPPQTNFLTVPHELEPIAHSCKRALRDAGFTVKIEYSETHFPEIATILGKRQRERHFYVFDARVKLERVRLWASYGRSCSTTTFIVLCVPQDIALSAQDIAQVHALGVGLTSIDAGGALTQIVVPVDLSLNIPLPPLARHRGRAKQELTIVHNRFARGEWRIGFEDACKFLEKMARDYLRREANAGRVQMPGKGGALNPVLAKSVNRLPLGALADVFCKKVIQTQIDAQLCTGLKRINPDRINVAHAMMTPANERKLRANIGHHMWTIDNLIAKIPT